MKQVLIFDTAIATSNIGDEIIMDGCKKGLESILKESLCFRLGTHISNYSPIQCFRNWKIKVLCDNADYKFVLGTNCLTSDFIRKAQWRVNFFNKRMYKDAILVGVGRIGNYDMPTKYSQKLYKSFLSENFKHSVRDEETKRVLEQMGFKAINTGCPTLWGFTPEKCKQIPQGKAEKCILSVSGYGSQLNREADQKMIDIIRKNYKECYVWIQTAVDEKYFKTLNNIKNVKYIYSLEKYAEILDAGNCDYIGTRLHGGIFALQHNCRSVIISIDERARGFHETNNIPILEREDIEKLDEIINGEIKTDIRVDRDAINEFVSQFK